MHSYGLGGAYILRSGVVVFDVGLLWALWARNSPICNLAMLDTNRPLSLGYVSCLCINIRSTQQLTE